MKICIVEDEASLARTLKLNLEAHNYEVVHALNGASALELITSERPDLILTDQSMPGMSGFSLIQKLRERADFTKNIPIIVVAAHPMPEIFAPGDIQGFMEKPYELKALLTKIEELLKNKKPKNIKVRRALLVGADPEAMRPVREVLESAFFEIVIARDSFLALQSGMTQNPSVFFISTHLAGMEVWELCKMLRELPLTQQVPIVVFDAGNVGAVALAQLKVDLVIDYNTHEALKEKGQSIFDAEVSLKNG